MTTDQKLKLDLPVLLPDVPQVRDRCVDLLISTLKGKPGVGDAHISGTPEAPQLCVHYDSAAISLSRLREIAQATGAKLTDEIGHLLLQSPPSHARVARRWEAEVRGVAGVLEVHAAPTGSVYIEFDRSKVSEEALHGKLTALGFNTVPVEQTKRATSNGHQHGIGTHEHGDAPHQDHSHEGHDHAKGESGEHSHGGVFGEKSELVFALLAGAAVLASWAVERWALASNAIVVGFAIAAYVFGGFFTVREAIENIRAKRFEIDTLMLVAAAGAATLGKWTEGGLLLFLFSLGHSLEHYAMGRARRAIEALAKLAPERAQVRRGDVIQEVDVASLEVGDVVIVRPNERFPADGFVVVGETSVDQAPVTGESVPVEKRPVPDREAALQGFDKLAAQHRVFAGTINGSGAIEVVVARKAGESTMARVVRLVTEAETQRSPTQNFTEKFERIFVPLVLALVVLLLFAGFVIDEPFSASFYRAMAVLVAASPCALAISVPSAVLSGVARAGRGGVLVKGGGPLENLGTLSAIAFDKTGTLTEGKPKLTEVRTVSGASVRELLEVAYAVEEHSDHPLAAAIVAGAKERLSQEQISRKAEQLQSITGRGVRARVDGADVYVGKAALFDEVPGAKAPAELVQMNQELMDKGCTTMLVRSGERYLGVLGVMDTPRPVAKDVMAALKSLGIERLIMISGDNQRVTDAVGKSVGLTEARGDLMPEDKVAAIKQLRTQNGMVAMVGDGVNDAPALAQADIGFAMGAAGTATALETADVAIMDDDPRKIADFISLSRRCASVLKQNIGLALGIKVVFLALALSGHATLWMAVFADMGASLLVVFNGLRLLRR